MPSKDERRRHHRTPCCVQVDIDTYDAAGHARMSNIGLGGAFLEAPPETALAVGQELVLTIPYTGKADYLIIKGTVAWQRRAGFGVRFLKKAA